MEKYQVFALVHTDTHGTEAIVDLLLYSEKEFSSLHFSSIIEGSAEKWFIDDPHVLCKVDHEVNLLQGLMDKSPNHSMYREFISYYQLVELKLVPGHYIPRIARPQLIRDNRAFLNERAKIAKLEKEIYGVRNYLPFESASLITGLNQLAVLVDELKKITRTVEPHHENLKTYGHELRNLLLLICTEVEAQLRGIYDASYKQINNDQQLRMKDYRALNEALRMEGYEVHYSLYPHLAPYRPFSYWMLTKAKPLLKWYNSYNAVKHDREKKFSEASLDNVLEALAGLACLFVAQYGMRIPYWDQTVGEFFSFSRTPEWNVHEFYLPPFKGEDWTPGRISL